MRRSCWRITTEFVLPAYLVLFAHPGAYAGPLCPGNAASITPRFVQHTLIVIPVKVNGEGPFDFIVDTGTQITVIDPALAIQLTLKQTGTIGLAVAANRMSAPTADVASIEADSHIVEKTLVIIEDLAQIQAVDPHIRGMLGENFLARFDVLFDYRHKMFCLDNTEQMRHSIKGEPISLVDLPDSEGNLPFAPRLVIPVQLFGAKGRRLLLRIDSGTNAPTLFGDIPEAPLWMRKHLSDPAHLAGTAEQVFDLLPPQDLRIGTRNIRRVAFVTPVRNGSSTPKYEQDGLLPTMLFQRVFISADRWIVFDPE